MSTLEQLIQRLEALHARLVGVDVEPLKSDLRLLLAVVKRQAEALQLILVQREGFEEEFFERTIDQITDCESDLKKLLTEDAKGVE